MRGENEQRKQHYRLLRSDYGVHPKHGLMCDENRKGGILFELDEKVVKNLKTISDWNALGGFIGLKAYDKIPVVTNLQKISIEQAKASLQPHLLHYTIQN